MNAIRRIVRRTVRAAVALSAVLGVTLAAPAQAQIALRSSAWMTLSGSGMNFQSGAGVAASAASGDVAPALPAGWQPSDLFLAVVESRDALPATLPGGWTLLNEGGGAGGLHRASLFWKWAAAGDVAPTVSHPGGGRIIAQIYYFRAVDRVNPFDAANSFTASPADLNTEADGINVATNNSLLVLSAQIGESGSASSPGWTPLGSGSAGVPGDGVSVATYTKSAGAAGPYPAATVTHSYSAESHGAQLALRLGRLLPVAKPAGTQANDVMLASVLLSGQNPSSTAPAGWTLVRRLLGGVSGGSTLEIYLKVAGASEPAQYTWTLGGIAFGPAGAVIQSFSGVDAINPIDAEAGQNTAWGLTHATPSIATTAANAMLVGTHGYRSSGTWSPPAGMTEVVDIAAYFVPAGGGVSLETSYALQALPGATGAKTATASGNADGGHAHLLALRPAPATAQVYYIHADHLNTPRLVANATGTTVWRWDQAEPFGNTVPDENPSALGAFDLPLRLPGQYFDKETNNHYNYFRDYDPSLGRYGESDPLGLIAGINTYVYGAAKPLHLTDRLGLEPGNLTQRGYPLPERKSICGADDGRKYPMDFGGWSFETPCRNHDNCYSICRKPKPTCDDEFLADAMRECSRIPAWIAIIMRQGLSCQATATEYYWALILLCYKNKL